MCFYFTLECQFEARWSIAMAEHCYYNAHQQKTKENGRHDKDMTKPSSNMGIGPGLVSRLIGYLVPHGPLYKAAHTYSQSQLWIAKAYFFIGSVHNRSNHPKITACIIVPPVFKKEKKKTLSMLFKISFSIERVFKELYKPSKARGYGSTNAVETL